MGTDETPITDPKLKELADETARLNAELEKLKAQKALDDARNEAATATAKSIIGEIPESPYTGDVELNEGMGVIESAALAARAVTQAATKIAGSLRGDGGTTLKDATVCIFQVDEMPKLDEAIVFDGRLSIVEEALKTAIKQSEKLLGAERAEERRGLAPTFIAPAIEAAVKLLDLFRTDYSIAGVEISGYDQALLLEVAGALLRDKENAPAAVHIPSLLFPEKIIGDAEKSFVEKLKNVTREATKARRYQTLHASQAETLAKEIDKGSDPEKKKLQKEAKAHEKAAEDLGDAIQMYDALLGASDADGVTATVRLATLVKAQGLREALRQKESYVLALKVFKSGGTYYKKKSFWNVFRPWRIPVFLSGGVVCGFALLNGEGRVLASGSLPTHSPFVGLSDFGRSGETGDKPWYEDQQETPAEDDF